MTSETWDLGSPAGDSGTAGRGTVGTDALTTWFSRLLRVVAFGYAAVGAIAFVYAFAWLPWSLLLIVMGIILEAAAFFLFVIAAGIARMESDDRDGIS